MPRDLIVLFGVLFIFLMTTLGSALVYLFKKDLSVSFKQIFLGFASGIMIAASVWSLLLPSIDTAISNGNMIPWIPAAIGFLLGGVFLFVIDKIVPHFHSETNQEEGPKNKLKRSTKLFLAVTIHNIPEGLAVGLAFGLGIIANDMVLIYSALGLAIGMGFQNFPEGAALSLPMKEVTKSNHKAFLYGFASGVVEPIAAVVGIILATSLSVYMPWFLAFAAGAMIYVVVEELIPEAHLGEHSHYGTWSVMVGFVIMMILDVALG